MTKLKTKEAITTVYGMLWDLLALCEKTEHYNKHPDAESNADIEDYVSDQVDVIKAAIAKLTLGNTELREKLYSILDESEYFLRRYEIPGVVGRWRQINPLINFFDCAFDLAENSPELYNMMRIKENHVQLAIYPNDELIALKNQYFEHVNQQIEDRNLRYSEVKIFQNELLRTLTLVFEHDFKEVL